MRTGVFGGAFDPPHSGHLIIAEGVRDELELDRILFIPYSVGPHRSVGPAAVGSERLSMLELLLAEEEAFIVDDREIRRGGVSYMVETLRSLADDYPGDELFLIVGSDQIEIFAEWKEWKAILDLATIAVIERPGTGLAGGPPELDAAMVKITLPLLLISSTMVRERVLAGRSIRYLVPDAVARYIEENNLYKGENR